MPFNKKLNEAQRKALCHYKGPAMILAGPGSGKTTVLTGRIGHLIEQYHVPPRSILVITYTKAAALSMQHRFIREMKGCIHPVVFGTFHAIFFHILKEQYHLGKECLITPQEKFRILYSVLNHQTNIHKNSQINSQINNQAHNQIHDSIETKPGTESLEELLTCISLLKNGIAEDKLPLPANVSQEAFHGLYRAYNRRMAELGKMDFDDMLLHTLTLFKKEPKVLSQWQKRFSHILVDEFQDSNRVQYEVLKLLAAPLQNLFVVGDDDQSIYGFRGASPGIMQQFMKDYPRAERILLEANYRSREEIVMAANRVIVQNKDRFAKNMYAAGRQAAPGTEQTSIRSVYGTEPVSIKAFLGGKEQYGYLSDKLQWLSQYFPFKEMAVICRTHREIEYVMPYLVKKNIPCTVKEQIKSRYAHFAIQDVVAYIELAAGKNIRRLFLQIMNKPLRYLDRGCLFEETLDLDAVALRLAGLGKKEAAQAVRCLQRQLKQAGKLSPYLAINLVRKAIGYDVWLRGKAGENTDLYEEWKVLLDELQTEAKAFKSIPEWLAYIKLEEEKAEGIKKGSREGVQLMTMHASKGLEFSYVCIPNVNEGMIPYGRMLKKEAEEEERRLFYVGMTRAKTALELLYLTGTEEHKRLPSRFLHPFIKNYSSSPSTSSSNS